MDAEITPQAGELEREAILTALERTGAGAGSGHRNAWHEAGLDEATAAAEDGGAPQPAARPRSTPGATRA
ncbi:MAG: hypothetical protein HY511_09185 [Actinobacteria bacterium]|nr:hypothetical protein [Actinomycetota bacterium]